MQDYVFKKDNINKKYFKQFILKKELIYINFKAINLSNKLKYFKTK